ncbi:MAG: type II secretion system protein [bacterium]|nr:type II secretion system protein [bacterium]
MTNSDKNKGFTLVEVLVAVSIFAMVMLVATGAVFSIVEANKKTHSLKSVMTNLNFALESMARDMRVGSQYSCSGECDPDFGTDVFSYKANRSVDGDGVYDPESSTDRIEYSLDNGRIFKYITGLSAYPITAEEIHIESLRFYAVGTAEGDRIQPKVLISIRGYAGVGVTRSEFNIQTTVSQRSIDS